ncbi:hypothetical protein DENSPDRAFT_851846 [Dentipellis sp. KUC8613]|nr:hypothetical protein DENSPDRAFT_851846 [Dentipellis sp. KUC8613]
MSSVNNMQGASQRCPQPGPSQVTPLPAQSSSDRPRSKHAADMRQIRLDCLAALDRKDRGEITHQEFMRIARECLERKKAREAASRILCERAEAGEVSLEEFSRECGYSEEDWEKVGPGIERNMEIFVANTRHIRGRSLRNQTSRGH